MNIIYIYDKFNFYLECSKLWSILNNRITKKLVKTKIINPYLWVVNAGAHADTTNYVISKSIHVYQCQFYLKHLHVFHNTVCKQKTVAVTIQISSWVSHNHDCLLVRHLTFRLSACSRIPLSLSILFSFRLTFTCRLHLQPHILCYIIFFCNYTRTRLYVIN